MMAARVPETAPAAGFPDSSFKYTPLRHVRVLFIRFVQGLFAAAPEGCYRWDEDEQLSEIIIVNESRIDPEIINKRPGITFTRGPVSFYSMGIDDLMSYEADISKKTKGVLIPGTMTINCVSRVPQEAEDLAWVVAEHLWLLRDLLMKAGFFEIGRQPQIGSPSPAGSIVSNDQGDEFTVVAVSIPYQFPRTSAVTPLGKRIVGSIENRLTVNPLRRLNNNGLPAAYPGGGTPAYLRHEVPLGITACPPPSFAPDASDVYNRSPDPAGRRDVFLPKQPHPLNPAVQVNVRTVRPGRRGIAPIGSGAVVPISNPCVEESS